MTEFFQTFIPLSVAIDVFGVLPLFVGLTEGLSEDARRRLARQSVMTAFGISILFLIAGKLLFQFLGITENDFRVGGGIVLLVLAVTDLLFSHEQERRPTESIGVVPIGIPLIMGPAALTTILYTVNAFGYGWAVIALVLNLLIVLVVFLLSGRITRALGKPGSQAIAKVAALFLAGIAVMMIRSGVLGMIRGS